VHLKGGKSIECDYVFETSGRQANVQGLGLENVSIEFSERGVKVNEFMQTKLPNVYASGDVVDKRIPRLTPTATFSPLNPTDFTVWSSP
jgi:glutathione reductase (NADPH)